MNVSLIALVLSNLVPLIGVLVFGWTLFEVMLVYWIENIVVGFWNVVKILTAKRGDNDSWGVVLLFAAFFVFHYGAFCAGHGVFVFAFFGSEFSNGEFVPFEYVYFSWGAVLGAVALFVSHGVSYFWNYLGKGEYKKPGDLMAAPYGRMMILHVTIVIGGGLIMVLNQPILALLLLVVLKIGFDIKSHRKQHRKLQAA